MSGTLAAALLVAAPGGAALGSWTSAEHVSGVFHTRALLTAQPAATAESPVAVRLTWTLENAVGGESFFLERAGSSSGTDATVIADHLTGRSYLDDGPLPASDGGCPVGAVQLSATTCSLTQDTDYWYRVGYRLGTWTSDDGPWVRATTTTRATLSADGTPDRNTMTLDWDSAPFAGTSPPSYALERASAPDSKDQTPVYRGTDLSAVDRGEFAAAEQPFRVASSYQSTCVVDVTGQISCWGMVSGKWYLTSSPKVYSAASVSGALGGSRAAAIVAQATPRADGPIPFGNESYDGGYCVLSEDGEHVACWIMNNPGTPANGGTTLPTSPQASYNVDTLTQQAGRISQLSISTGARCLLTSGSRVYCWGSGWRGELGDGSAYYYQGGTPGNASFPDPKRPVLLDGVIQSGSTITKLVSGDYYSCVLTDRSEVACWGNTTAYNTKGSISAAANRPWLLVPAGKGILGGQKILQLWGGGTTLCGLAADGTVACWGSNVNGQLATGSTGAGTGAFAAGTAPVPATALNQAVAAKRTKVQQIAIGGSYGFEGGYSGWACAVTENGQVWCWGQNDFGQLGNGNTTSSPTPVVASSDAGPVLSISAGHLHVCVQSASLALRCWGNNSFGQVGSPVSPTWMTPATMPLVPVSGCPWGSVKLTGTSCSLAADTVYYYRVTYTLNELTVVGEWVPLRTRP
ncbi:RCC1 domain-containing protein [Leifsonia aquatica]|uniref:RCC1 domain-containing protein n=1 Tax=Leifsonia aquatica TaxID=144185 RepID=UPI0013B36AF6|nr:hypothetical protein [Leifsonia aquatica]